MYPDAPPGFHREGYHYYWNQEPRGLTDEGGAVVLRIGGVLQRFRVVWLTMYRPIPMIELPTAMFPDVKGYVLLDDLAQRSDVEFIDWEDS